MKKEFKLGERVIIHRTSDKDLDGNGGTILGKSLVSSTDFYIVMLDVPTPTHLALSIIESCLDRVN